MNQLETYGSTQEAANLKLLAKMIKFQVTRRAGKRDCPLLHVSRAITILISIISIIICLSLSSSRQLGVSAQLAPRQSTAGQKPFEVSPQPTWPNSIKISQQQQQQQQRGRQWQAHESNLVSNAPIDANENVTNKQTNFKPPPLIETTTAVPRFALIARTSDAIYRKLSGYFSHEDEDRTGDELGPIFGSKLITTTPAPSVAIKMTTKWPETTTTNVGNLAKRTTSSGGGGVLTSIGRAQSGGATTMRVVRTTPAAFVSQTTGAPQSKLTTVAHLDLGRYTDQSTIASRVKASTSPRPTTTTTPTLATRYVTTTFAPAPPSTHVAPLAKNPIVTLKPAGGVSIQQPQRPFPVAKPLSLNLTTLAPAVQALPFSTSVISQRGEFFSFLSQAIKSIGTPPVDEFAYLSSANKNRSTRLAPPLPPPLTTGVGEGEHESEETTATSTQEIRLQANVPPSDKLLQMNESPKQQAISAHDDILLLCKLLHKHLESTGRKNEDGSITLTLNAPLAANLSSSSPTPTVASASHSIANGPTSTTSTSKPAHYQRGRPAELPEDSLSAGARLINDPQRELSELQHEDRLLESTFALDLRQQTTHENRSNEHLAEELLLSLYNLGFSRKRMMKSSANNAESHEADEYAGSSYQPEVDTHPHAANISLRVWSRTTTGGSGAAGRLKLVYWLLELVRVPANTVSGAGNLKPSAARYRVLDLLEAGELLDQLEHAHVQQLIDALAVVRPIVLVAAHKRGGVADDLSSPQVRPPLVLDDSLATSSPGGGGSGDLTLNNNNRTTLHLFVDKLTQLPFSDNLHLYLILFLLALFLLIMCFAVPALCCKCMMPARAASMKPGGRRAAGNRRLPAVGRRDRHRVAGSSFQPASYNNCESSPVASGAKSHLKLADPLRASISSISRALGAFDADSGSKQLNEGGAIWRKLSNSTTTLTKEELRSLENEGHMNVSVISGDRNYQQPQSGRQNNNNNNKKKFEWYTFEDNQTLRKTTTTTGSSSMGGADSHDRPDKTHVVRDQRKLTKSIQTYLAGDQANAAAPQLPLVSSPTSGASGHFSDSIDCEHLSMAYRDRMETRNSDTMTKSELVMLKEKLIPIRRELRAQQQQQQQQQHDYVNTGQAPGEAARQVARHIDSTSVDSGPGNGNGHGSGNGRNRPVAPVSAAADENQRAPRMRYLELPAGSQTPVGGARNELEARDSAGRPAPAGLRVPAGTNRSTSSDQQQQLAGATYKRYDVI